MLTSNLKFRNQLFSAALVLAGAALFTGCESQETTEKMASGETMACCADKGEGEAIAASAMPEANGGGCGMMGEGREGGCDMMAAGGDCGDMEGCDKTKCPQLVAIMDKALDSWNAYGTVDSINRTPIGVEALTESAEEAVTVVGTIAEVCTTKGCWMIIADEAGERNVRVTFKDYSFFVPMNSAGRQVVVSGQSKVVTRDVETLRHFAEDKGATATELAAITEPEEAVEIVAELVYIEGEGLDAPHQP